MFISITLLTIQYSSLPVLFRYQIYVGQNLLSTIKLTLSPVWLQGQVPVAFGQSVNLKKYGAFWHAFLKHYDLLQHVGKFNNIIIPSQMAYRSQFQWNSELRSLKSFAMPQLYLFIHIFNHIVTCLFRRESLFLKFLSVFTMFLRVSLRDCDHKYLFWINSSFNTEKIISHFLNHPKQTFSIIYQQDQKSLLDQNSFKFLIKLLSRYVSEFFLRTGQPK